MYTAIKNIRLLALNMDVLMHLWSVGELLVRLFTVGGECNYSLLFYIFSLLVHSWHVRVLLAIPSLWVFVHFGNVGGLVAF